MATVDVGIFTPRITYLLVTVLVAMFLLQLALGDHQGAFVPTTPALLAIGALYQPFVVDEHEWYRVIQSGFLHADAISLPLRTRKPQVS